MQNRKVSWETVNEESKAADLIQDRDVNSL